MSIFFLLFIEPKVILLPFGIKIESYPKPFLPNIFSEIFPCIVPIVVIFFIALNEKVKLHINLALVFFFFLFLFFFLLIQ